MHLMIEDNQTSSSLQCLNWKHYRKVTNSNLKNMFFKKIFDDQLPTFLKYKYKQPIIINIIFIPYNQ